MPLKRRIPPQYVFKLDDLVNAIHGVLGRVRVDVEGQVITIDANPTAAEKTALKAAVIAVLEDVPDITA